MFGGLRIGLYDPVKKLIVGKDHVGDVGLGQKIAADLFTGARAKATLGERARARRSGRSVAALTLRCAAPGALAITIASPTDLVKVRMQTEGKLPPGCVRRCAAADAAQRRSTC